MKQSEEQEKGARLFSISIKQTARKFLESLDDRYFSRIDEKITQLKTNPYPSGSRKLVSTDFRRLRAGSFRIIYVVDHDKSIITILDIDHRKDVYRKK